MAGLSVSNIVNVTVNLSPTGAVGLSFGVLMIGGDSPVINGVERFRTYLGISGVVVDFGTNTPEYQAAAKYFGQSPSPARLMIGRWLSTATSAQDLGGFLSPSQTQLSNFTSISSGGLVITIDGVVKTLTGLNFTGATNLNGVASIITTALAGSGVCVWTGNNFTITSSTVGAGIAAIGAVTFTTNPAVNDTLILNGVTLTFVASGATGPQILIGATAQSTAANLQQYLNTAVQAGLILATYSTSLGVTTVTYTTVGVAGNAYTMVRTGTALSLSGATLSGGQVPSSVGYATVGAGTDLSVPLKLTALLAQALIPGFNAEQPVDFASAVANISPDWYGLMFSASTQPTNLQSLAVSNFIEATGGGISRIYGVTIQDTAALSSLSTSDLAAQMQAAAYNRSFSQYSSSTPYAIASFFGRAFTVNFTGTNTTITLMFKQEPGVVGEFLAINQALTLKSKNCNVFVNYVNSTVIIQYGTMASGLFFDVIHGTDWLQNAMQTAGYNTLYTSTTKIPQTDAGVNQIVSALAAVCAQGVANGLIAGGTWNATGFGTLAQGQFLKAGFYIYATPLSLQSQSDRTTRVAPPIQIAVKLAGAIQSVNVAITVNQ